MIPRPALLLACLAGAHLTFLTAAEPPPPAMPTPLVTVRDYAKDRSIGPAAPQSKVVKSDAEWRKLLSAEAFRVARGKDTERPFCGAFYDNHQTGVYECACCHLPLFRSDAKFDSGTGWPSFFQPVAKENIACVEDRSHNMVRTEILCARCDCHLGHVFEDGPKPTGLRYCLNSVSLSFVPDAPAKKSPPAPAHP